MEGGALVAKALLTGAEGSEILCRKSTKWNSEYCKAALMAPNPKISFLLGRCMLCIWDTFKPIQTPLEEIFF